MRKRKPEETLEEYLKDRSIPDDPQLASLARAADRLERSLDVEAPDAYGERALFIQGVAARRPGFPWARLMVPVMAASLFVLFVALGRDAQPGDALYGFRTALTRVGLAEDPGQSAIAILNDAEEELERGNERLDSGNFIGARGSAEKVLRQVQQAKALLEDASGERREEGLERAEDVLDGARELNEEIEEEEFENDPSEQAEERLEREEERREEAEEAAEEEAEEAEEAGEDNSGSGSDDSGGDDNSGSGSDSGGDDNSGSGSDDSGGDDSSGSGSGGDSGSDDSSGSGGGDDD